MEREKYVITENINSNNIKKNIKGTNGVMCHAVDRIGEILLISGGGYTRDKPENTTQF